MSDNIQNNNQDTSQDVCIATMGIEIKNIKEKLDKMPNKDEMKLAISDGIKLALEDCNLRYATKDSVKMLEKIVYGFVGMILTAVGGAIIYSVLK